MNLNELRDACFQNSLAHGFYGDIDGEVSHEEFKAGINIGEKIALMHTELSEAFEEYRKGCHPTKVYFDQDDPHAYPRKDSPDYGIVKPEGIPIELADCLIRILDFCGAFQIDIEEAVKLKMKYNSTRPYKHGKKL